MFLVVFLKVKTEVMGFVLVDESVFCQLILLFHFVTSIVGFCGALGSVMGGKCYEGGKEKGR